MYLKKETTTKKKKIRVFILSSQTYRAVFLLHERFAMRSHSIIIISVITMVCCSNGMSPPAETDHVVLSSSSSSSSLPSRSNGRLMSQQQRVNRETDGGGGGVDDFYNHNDSNDRSDGHPHRTVNTYHHVSDSASSSASTDGGGWIIGGSRRRASAATQKHYQDKTTASERPDKQREPADKHQWPAVSVPGPEAASSLSEVQVVVHQSPHHDFANDQQQQQSFDVASKWYSKRLSYATKSSLASSTPSPSLSPQQQQPVAAASNAVLLAEVLGQKSGFNMTAGKGAVAAATAGYYGSTTTGSKGFQNDLMDMLGKSM